MLDNYPYLDIYYPYIDSMQTSELPLFEYRNSEKPITQDIERTLNSIFPQQPEITKAERSRGILGELSRDFTDAELRNIVSDFEYLSTQWIDKFEREIFSGITLSEILQ